jgi:putative phage-type endonuclease
MIQGSPEWHAARLGKVTASRIADVMAKTKSGWGAGRANYMAELVCERLTQTPTACFVNDAMRWGTETEPQARAAYARLRDVDVLEVGFLDHPEIPSAGASPDGLVGLEGLIECKCPNTSTHIDTLLSETVPQKYMLQMQFQMAVTGRDWCDFVSFDPRLPEEMSLFVARVPRDVSLILEIESEVTTFLRELDAKVARLTERYARAA